MSDTAFIIHPGMRPRLATVHQRHADGSLAPIEHEISQEPEFFMGGGGIYGTAGDYAGLCPDAPERRAGEGRHPVLKQETIDLMGRTTSATSKPAC